MWPRLGHRVIRNGVTVKRVPLGETLSLWAATHCPGFHFHKYAIGAGWARTGVWEHINLASFHITANGCASVSTRMSLADQNMSQTGWAYLIQAWRGAPLWIMDLAWICGYIYIARCFLKNYVACCIACLIRPQTIWHIVCKIEDKSLTTQLWTDGSVKLWSWAIWLFEVGWRAVCFHGAYDNVPIAQQQKSRKQHSLFIFYNELNEAWGWVITPSYKVHIFVVT